MVHRHSFLSFLTHIEPRDTLRIMETILICKLHMHTGKWVIITDRGRPVSAFLPILGMPQVSFRDRTLVRSFANLPAIASDSGQFLEEDRR